MLAQQCMQIGDRRRKPVYDNELWKNFKKERESQALSRTHKLFGGRAKSFTIFTAAFLKCLEKVNSVRL